MSRENIVKECEICGGTFNTLYKQTKYCEKCRINPESARRKIEYAMKRMDRFASNIAGPKSTICKQCGKEFKTYRDMEVCSKECLQQYKIKNATCEICGINLYELGILTGKGVCSEKCNKLKEINKQALKIIKAKERGNYTQCVECNKMFISSGYSDNCCSTECKRKKREKIEIKQKKLSEQKKQEMIESKNNSILTCKCLYCNKEFQRHRNSKQYYCSYDCSNNDTKRKKDILVEQRRKNNEHLCTDCKTSQAECEWFTSNFVYHPVGCKSKRINGKSIVYSCPKFRDGTKILPNKSNKK